MPQSEALPFLHVLAVVIQDDGPVLGGDLAGGIGGMGVGEDDFVTVARVSLPEDGRENIVQQGPRVQRGHDETQARPWMIIRT